MGLCFSASNDAQREASELIDKELKKDRHQFDREVKILLLGAGDSGKSTVMKQAKLIHKGGFSPEERENLKAAILDCFVDAMRSIAACMPLEGRQVPASLVEPLQLLRDKRQADKEFFATVCQIRDEPSLKQFMLDAHKYAIMESVTYFMENAQVLAAPDYRPSDLDILRSRVKTTGMNEIRFEYKDKETNSALKIHMIDVGGQRSERKKWIHHFENVTAILFCVDLTSYDMFLTEDQTQNRMVESILLFDAICNSQWFRRTHVILFLNKFDLLKEKITRSSISTFFPAFKGSDDPDKVVDFVRDEFMATDKIRWKGRMIAHTTTATERKLMQKVFRDVCHIIVKSNLQEAGLM